ncbi:MAG: FAD-binding oxidoreductase [Desulfurococcales archaeon]|nr:FAD-binding oxidoreductase [Desulfurococcales archaeon]
MFDYIVVGAGIVGLSTAYHIKRLDPGASVLVIDKAPGPGGGDTGRSAAAFRAFFTNKANMLLSKSSIAFYRSVQEAGFDLGMRFIGYLWLVDRRAQPRVDAALRHADALGLPYERVDLGLVEERLGLRASVRGLEEAELMGLDDVGEAILVKEAGILDPDRLVEYYYEKLRSMGVEFRFGSRVVEFIVEPRRPLGIEGEPLPWQDSRVSGVRLEGGLEARARRKVIAALGAWSDQALRAIGVDPVSKPKKRQIFVVRASTGELSQILHARGFNAEGVMPFTILPRDVLIRPEPREEAFWIGLSDNLGRPFKLEEPPAPEEHYYTLGILPVLSAYMPAFEGLYPETSWAGHYDMSPDGLPVVYEPFDSDLIVACGTSGSGIMKGDAIGRVAASLALGLEEAELADGSTMPVAWLGVQGRMAERELLII